MYSEILYHRLLELYQEYGSKQQLANALGVHRLTIFRLMTHGQGMLLTTMHRIGQNSRYIPIVFRTEDGLIEYLDKSEPSSLKEIQNYEGRVIRKYREGKGYSVKDLERISKVNTSQIYQLEKNRRMISVARLEKLAHSLSLSIDYLVEPESLTNSFLHQTCLQV